MTGPTGDRGHGHPDPWLQRYRPPPYLATAEQMWLEPRKIERVSNIPRCMPQSVQPGYRTPRPGNFSVVLSCVAQRHRGKAGSIYRHRAKNNLWANLLCDDSGWADQAKMTSRNPAVSPDLVAQHPRDLEARLLAST